LTEKNRKQKLFFIIYNIAFIVVFLLIIEIIIGFYLRHPAKIPSKFLDVFREYYMINDRIVIQASPEFAIYNPVLCYTLKPGEFVFSNREFSNHFNVNSFGLRDDELSVDYPQIIVCGDSYAMGWGVEQNESFAEIIENQLKIKVLNAGISSYGTARELLSLKNLNTDSLKYLIIQYSDNDFTENSDFVANQFKLKITPIEDYTQMCRKHVRNQKYFLFKHVIFFPKIIAKWIIDKPLGVFDAEKPADNQNEQKTFLQIIENATFLPKDIKIIVFNMDYRKSKSDFIPQLQKEINSFPELKSKMVMFDFSKTMTDHYFYILDDHLNTKGHQLIAKSIIQYISKNN